MAQLVPLPLIGIAVSASKESSAACFALGAICILLIYTVVSELQPKAVATAKMVSSARQSTARFAPPTTRTRSSAMGKHFATFAGLALALAFVVVFFNGRYEAKPLSVVAPRVGLQVDDLLAMVPRVASQTGAT